jgi:hypothetical protein
MAVSDKVFADSPNSTSAILSPHLRALRARLSILAIAIDVDRAVGAPKKTFPNPRALIVSAPRGFRRAGRAEKQPGEESRLRRWMVFRGEPIFLIPARVDLKGRHRVFQIPWKSSFLRHDMLH